MKKFLILFLLAAALSPAQKVVLTSVTRMHENTDRVFYRIDSAATNATYLAELEVQGFSADDEAIFGQIYRQAKTVGANAFSFKPFETLTGAAKFDPAHYRLSLFYVDRKALPEENNVIYLIAGADKTQTISINKKNRDFPPRTFRRLVLPAGETTAVSTRGLLGSTLRLSGQAGQPVQYFQLSGVSLRSNPYGSAGVNLKSGDILRLEQSYGQFLTTIYTELKD